MRKSEIIKQNRIDRIRRHARIEALRVQNPALDALFVKLRTSTAPNFIEVMSAISEVSTLYPNADSASCEPRRDENRESSVSLCPLPDSRCLNCQ